MAEQKLRDQNDFMGTVTPTTAEGAETGAGAGPGADDNAAPTAPVTGGKGTKTPEPAGVTDKQS